jgi:hypothetical protein
MSALGHKRIFAVQKGMSALPPKADIRRRLLGYDSSTSSMSVGLSPGARELFTRLDTGHA